MQHPPTGKAPSTLTLGCPQSVCRSPATAEMVQQKGSSYHHLSPHFCSSLQKEAGNPQGHCWAGPSILAQLIRTSAGIHQCRAFPGSVPVASFLPWKRNSAEKPPFLEVVQPSGRSPGVKGLQDLPVPSPSCPGWVLVTQQPGGPIHELSQEGWPWLGGGCRMVALRKGRLQRKATPTWG